MLIKVLLYVHYRDFLRNNKVQGLRLKIILGEGGRFTVENIWDIINEYKITMYFKLICIKKITLLNNI